MQTADVEMGRANPMGQTLWDQEIHRTALAVSQWCPWLFSGEACMGVCETLQAGRCRTSIGDGFLISTSWLLYHNSTKDFQCNGC